MSTPTPTRIRTEQVAAARALEITAIDQARRDWLLFLIEQRDEMAAAQMAASSVESDSFFATPATATVRRAPIPPQTRDELRRVLEMRRTEAQREAEDAARRTGAALPDPQQVLSDLLAQIQSELDGHTHPNGFALVWYDGLLTPFNFQAVAQRGTTDADYDAARGPNVRSPLFIVLAVAGALALGGALYLMRPNAETVVMGRAITADVNGTESEVWDVTALQVGTVASTATGTQLGMPLLLCASATQGELLTPGATLVVTGTRGIRTYTLTAPTGSAPDAVIRDCATTPPTVRAHAQLQTARSVQYLPATTVQHVRAYASAVDPARIPSDQMEVLLTLAASAPDGVLLLPDGTSVSPQESAVISDARVLRFIVPAQIGTSAMGYRSDTATPPWHVAVSVPDPTTRAQWLGRSVQVERATTESGWRDRTAGVTVTLTLRGNGDDPPRMLASDDIRVQTTQGVPQTISWQPVALTPGESMQVSVFIPWDGRTLLQIQLGTWRADLTPTGGAGVAAFATRG